MAAFSKSVITVRGLSIRCTLLHWSIIRLKRNSYVNWSDLCLREQRTPAENKCRLLIRKQCITGQSSENKQDLNVPSISRTSHAHRLGLLDVVDVAISPQTVWWQNIRKSSFLCVLIAISRKICMVSNADFGSVPYCLRLSMYIAARQFTTSQDVTWSSADEWMNLFAWQKNNKISQAGTPWHDNCVHLPVSWVTIRHTQLRVTID